MIDMRYENPLYMAEDAAAADLLAGGRLQLGISRGSPEPALRGSEAFGYVPAEGETDADIARRHTELFRAAIAGAPVVEADPADGRRRRPAADPAALRGPAGADLVGRRHPRDRRLDRRTGDEPDELDPAHRGHRRALRPAAGGADRDATWRPGREAGWERRPRISVSRSVLPIVSDLDHAFFGREVGGGDTTGYLDGGIARFGKTYAGEPDRIAAELADDAAVALADTLLLTVPNQLGVEYNADLLRNIAEHVAPAIGR